MSKITIFFFIFSVMTCVNLFSEKLLDVEMFYNSDKSDISGSKKYFYDDKKNIYLIKVFDSRDRLQSELKYQYENNLLLQMFEYSGKTLMKSSKFIYESEKLIKKVDYDVNGKQILLHKFTYNKEGLINLIEDYSADDVIIGRKDFIYEKGILKIENQFSSQNKILLSKKYIYKENKIFQIEYFSSQEEKLRIVERFYLNIDSKINEFGFSSNFFDLR